jgi:uncharacterized protein YndB with AHSA1/START domain
MDQPLLAAGAQRTLRVTPGKSAAWRRKMIIRTAQVLLIALLATGSVSAQNLDPIVSEAIIEAPVEAVWSAWSTAEGLRAWLAPHADIEMRPGGLMRTNYRAQGSLGDASTIENTVLSFDPGRMLSFRVARTPEGFPFPEAIQHMWTVIYLEPADDGHSRVRVVGLGFGPDEQSQRMRDFFQRGNDATLRQLQDHFAGREQ